MQNRLMLLAFVSYEAVRLWWWGGSRGVLEIEKTSKTRSIPTLASRPNQLELCGLEIFHSRVPAEVPANYCPGHF